MAYGSSSFGSEAYGSSSNITPLGVITYFLSGHLSKANIIITFTLDARIVSRPQKTFTLDARIVLRNTKTFTLDAPLQKKFTKTFTVDGLPLKTGITKSFTIDSKLIFRREKTFTLDTVIKKTFTKTFGLSARCYPGLFWLRPWRYRKKINLISQSASAQVNSTYTITVHYATGADNCNDVYLNGHARSDFGDIRFTKQDGQTELLYHLKEFVVSSTGTIDILVDYIPSVGNDKFIYIYYGDPTAQDASTRDLGGVSFFDGGENFVDGESLTDNGWLINLSTGGKGVYSNIRAFSGVMSLKLLLATAGHSNVAVWKNAIDGTKDFIEQGYLYDTTAGGDTDFGVFGLGTSAGGVIFYFGWEKNTNGGVYMKNIGGVRTGLGIARSVGWHLIKITYDSINLKLNVWFDGIQVVTNLSYTFTTMPHIYLGQYDNDGVWFDNINVIQNIADVACSTFGLEEKFPTPRKFFSHRVGLRVITG